MLNFKCKRVRVGSRGRREERGRRGEKRGRGVIPFWNTALIVFYTALLTVADSHCPGPRGLLATCIVSPSLTTTPLEWVPCSTILGWMCSSFVGMVEVWVDGGCWMGSHTGHLHLANLWKRWVGKFPIQSSIIVDCMYQAWYCNQKCPWYFGGNLPTI